MALIELRLVRVATDEALAQQALIMKESQRIAAANLKIVEALTAGRVATLGVAAHTLPGMVVETEARRLDVNRGARMHLQSLVEKAQADEGRNGFGFAAVGQADAYLSVDDLLYHQRWKERFDRFAHANLTVATGSSDVDTRYARDDLLDALGIVREAPDRTADVRPRPSLREGVYRITVTDDEQPWHMVFRITMARGSTVLLSSID